MALTKISFDGRGCGEGQRFSISAAVTVLEEVTRPGLGVYSVYNLIDDQLSYRNLCRQTRAR